MSAKNWGLLFFLALLWGSSFLFYKILVAVLPPVTVVLGRVGIAAIAMNLWLLAARQTLPLQGSLWRRFLLLGFLNNVLPFILIAWGETRIDSGMASILNATTPIFMVAVAHWKTEDEKLSWGKVVSISCGILGVIVLAGPDAARNPSSFWGELAVIGASCTYGFGGVYSRQFKDLPPLVAATGQTSAATILLVPLSLLIDHPWALAPPGAAVWLSLLAFAVINTALAYVVYYRMLADTGVTYISLVTFLIPVVALLLGAAILQEEITLRGLAGMAVIGLGLAAIDARPLKRLLKLFSGLNRTRNIA
ncbi:MAG TPA: DMT family transporter [Rhizomicrobium sp.]|nr:DMT family transporter [Rhizomicrobium sp.]